MASAVSACVVSGSGRAIQALLLAGDVIVSASSNGEIATWKLVANASGLSTKQVAKVCGAHQRERVTCLAGVPTNSGRSVVASGGFDGRVRLWSIPKLEPLGQGVSVVPPGVRLFAIDACPTHVAAGGGDDGGVVKGILSLVRLGASGRSLLTPPSVTPQAHNDNIYAVTFSSSGRSDEAQRELLWSGGRDGVLQLRELVLPSGYSRVLQRVVMGSSIRCIAFSAAYSAVWCGTSTGLVAAFDVELSVRSPVTTSVHHEAVYAMVVVASSGDCSRLLTCGKDGRICKLHGSRPHTKRRQGDPGATEELFRIPSAAVGASPYLESICSVSRSGKRPDSVVCGARDGRLVVLTLEAGASVLKKPAGAKAAALPDSLSVPLVRRRPAGIVATVPSRTGVPPGRPTAPSASKVFSVGVKKPIAKRPSAMVAPGATVTGGRLDGPMRRTGSRVLRWVPGTRWEP